jgi:subtilisin family serine protease
LVLLLVVLGVLAPAAGLPARAQAEDPPSGRYIVVLKGSRTDPEAVAASHAQRYGVEPSHVYRHALQGYAATVPDTELKALRRDRKVAWVRKDKAVALPERARYKTTAFKKGKAFTQIPPTGVDRIDADLSSALSGNGSGSTGVNVAVLDTGIDKSHRDLEVVGGVNCTKKKGSLDDTDGHGTLVAGIIGAKDDGKYVVGVAPGARLWSVVVVSKKGSASERSILCGLDFVIATRTDGDPANDIAVANLSLVGPGGDDGACGSVDQDALHQAVCRAVAAGVTVVAAAGNESQDLADATPAAYDEVLAVTAMADLDGRPGGLATTTPCRNARTMADDAAAPFSNFAVSPEDAAHTISAPGTCILSTYPKKNAAYGAGTSAASPHVAGVVALCIASGPCAGLTPERIIAKLIADAADHSAADPGYGFAGDPGRPVDGRYYGNLVRVAGY